VPRDIELSLRDIRTPRAFVFELTLVLKTPGVDGNTPPDADALSAIQNVLDSIEATPVGQIELGRFPETAKMLNTNHADIEVLNVTMTKTDMHDEKTLAEKQAIGRSAMRE
jgi:hypothetical protein